jgi:hypothetical protein
LLRVLAATVAVAMSFHSHGLGVAGAGTPPGSVGIKLLDAPVERADDPRAKLYIVDHVAPGTTIQRRLQVNNSLDEPTTVDLYPGAVTLLEGRFHAEPKQVTTELTEWTTVDPTEVTIEPGESAIATVTIVVPPEASVGERYGAIWAELPPTTSKDGVTAVNRVGIRIYLDVGLGGEPPSDFTIGKLSSGLDPDGRQLVTAPITNTGGRAIDVSGELNLSARVTQVGPFRSSTVTLAPGQEGVLVVPIRPATTRGPWNARLDAASGTITESREDRIRLPKPKKKVGKPAGDASGDWVPTALVVGAVAAVPIGAGLWMFRARSRHY